MPNFTNSEQIAFNEDLDRYQAKELAADNRAEWVESRVKDLMAEGQEYSPFKPSHVTEALSQLSDADAMLLGSYMQASYTLPNNDSAKINLSDFVIDRVQVYWHEMSVFMAQKEYDNKDF